MTEQEVREIARQVAKEEVAESERHSEETYVRKDSCDRTVSDQNKKFANDDKRLAVIEVYQKITLGVMSAVGVGVLGLVLNQIWGV